MSEGESGVPGVVGPSGWTPPTGESCGVRTGEWMMTGGGWRTFDRSASMRRRWMDVSRELRRLVRRRQLQFRPFFAHRTHLRTSVLASCTSSGRPSPDPLSSPVSDSAAPLPFQLLCRPPTLIPAPPTPPPFATIVCEYCSPPPVPPGLLRPPVAFASPRPCTSPSGGLDLPLLSSGHLASSASPAS